MEALTPLDRTSLIKMYKNNARSRLFCRIAKRSIGLVLSVKSVMIALSLNYIPWRPFTKIHYLKNQGRSEKLLGAKAPKNLRNCLTALALSPPPKNTCNCNLNGKVCRFATFFYLKDTNG